MADIEDPVGRSSYASIDCDEFALEEVERLAKLGYLKAAESYDACVNTLGGRMPMVSKFGMIVKTRFGKTKRRLIRERKELIVTDLIADAMNTRTALAHRAPVSSEHNFDWLVLDVKEAFWTLGLVDEERQRFIGKLRGEYYIYKRLAQGS